MARPKRNLALRVLLLELSDTKSGQLQLSPGLLLTDLPLHPTAR